MKILIIDDEQDILKALKREISQFFKYLEVYVCLNPCDAKKILIENQIDLLLSDHRMPIQNGLDFLIEIRSHYPHIPFILMSAYQDIQVIISAINEGKIVGFLTKPWTQKELYQIIEFGLNERKERMLLDYLSSQGLSSSSEWADALDFIGKYESSQVKQTLKGLLTLIRARDYKLYSHSVRVACYAYFIADAIGLSINEKKSIVYGAHVHDLGKVAIKDSIQYKPSKLSHDELDEMKNHVNVALDILSDLNIPKPIIDIVAQHHERVDGKGYPKGLKSPEILLEAKILTLADTFDALTVDRVYRNKLPLEEALAIISENKGAIYDTYVVEVFSDLLSQHAFAKKLNTTKRFS